MKTTITEFNQKALQKSELKPFKLVYSERGKRVWKSDNGLLLEAVKIGSNEYYDVSIIGGAKLGEINSGGQKVPAKEIQAKLSELATNYNFNYIKRQYSYIRKSEAGKQLYIDFCNLRRDYFLIKSY